MTIGGIVAATLTFIAASVVVRNIFGGLDEWTSIIMWPPLLLLPFRPLGHVIFLSESTFVFFFITASIAGNLTAFVTGAGLTGILLRLLTQCSTNITHRRGPYWWVFSICCILWTIGYSGVVAAALAYPNSRLFDSYASVFGPVSGFSSYILFVTTFVWLIQMTTRWTECHLHKHK